MTDQTALLPNDIDGLPMLKRNGDRRDRASLEREPRSEFGPKARRPSAQTGHLRCRGVVPISEPLPSIWSKHSLIQQPSMFCQLFSKANVDTVIFRRPFHQLQQDRLKG